MISQYCTTLSKWVVSLLILLIMTDYFSCDCNAATVGTKSKFSSSISTTITVDSTTQVTKNGYTQIDFNLLGDYSYEIPSNMDSLGTSNKSVKKVQGDQIPQTVKSLNGKKVSIEGYFYPVEIGEGGTITEFMLLRNQIQCCFGDAVQINEWISVTMSDGKPIKSDFTSRTITLYGKLEVGEKFDNGYLVNLYRMKADKLVENK